MSDEIRKCVNCSGPLSGRQVKFCQKRCSYVFNRNVYLMEHYGITLKQFDELLAFQGGVCAVCKYPPVGKRIMVVDHEHTNGRQGKVRGILCLVCNLKFISREKKSDRFRNAADYLDNPPAVTLFGEIIAKGVPPKPRKRRAPRKGKA